MNIPRFHYHKSSLATELSLPFNSATTEEKEKKLPRRGKEGTCQAEV
jgi:hypothetical protein